MMDRALGHVVFSGGGTAGHLFPGLAVAEKLRQRLPQLRITFAGSGKPLERRSVAQFGFDYLALPCRPLPRGPWEAVSFLLENFAGYLAARRFLAEGGAGVVVGLGGYASVPLGRAARRSGVPLVLLDQNAVPGRATRWLARWAAMVCLSMPAARGHLRCPCPVYVTGNPLRSGFGPSATGDRRQLLILGGSGGAAALNEHVPRALYRIREQLADWRVVHQAGQSGWESTRQLYRKLALEATVVEFIHELPEQLAETALAVCRAGGTTLAELAAAGVPAILLPYPHAADDHQRHNAAVFTRAGGAITLDQRELSGRLDHHLGDAMASLLADPQRRAQMSLAMLRLAQPNAAERVAELILPLLDRGRAAAA